MKHFSHRLSRAALLAAGMSALFGVSAQAGIEIQKPVPVNAPAAIKPGVAATVTGSPGPMVVVVGATEAPALKPPAPEPSFEIKKGSRIDHQLAEYGKIQGWELIWEAPEFVFDKNKMLPGNFEAALVFFLNGVNETGEHLRATFYRGNKTVRVTEF